MKIITLNAGSSSIKYKVFSVTDDQFSVLISGIIESIGEKQSAWQHQKHSQTLSIADHQHAMQLLSKRLKDELNDLTIDVVTHRVVHGGTHYNQPTIIDNIVIHQLKQLYSLAPLHNPANVTCIEIAKNLYKDAKHIAFFDTAFHQSMPAKAYTYALPKTFTDKHAIRRYGFHGSNHHYVAQQAANYLKKPMTACQLISLHLGNGASVCLIKQGNSFDTSMGMTPLPGLVMGTRCGDIDPSILLYLMNLGYTADKIDHLLNKQSGLKGLCGVNDMRQIEQLAQSGDQSAQLAIELFCYRIQHYIGAYYTQTPQLDALIFTGGIGENASNIRQKIIESLAHLGLCLDTHKNQQKARANCIDIAKAKTPILVIKGDEELYMATQACSLLS